VIRILHLHEKNNSLNFKNRNLGGSIGDGVALQPLPVASLFFLVLLPGC